jgi:hypothetical protein
MAGISFSDGQLLSSLRASYQDVADLGKIPERVSAYLGKGEVDPPSNAAERLQLERGMWRFLQTRRARLDSDARFNTGGYDELLFSAYDNALRVQSGGTDPLDNVYRGDVADSGSTAWDFRVDTFETIAAQGIDPRSIRAAGAIDYVFEMGERLRIFDIAEELVHNWSYGLIDVPDGTAAGKLYRYKKLLDVRDVPVDRGKLYRRVLNKGDAALGSRGIANADFPRIWEALMAEVADYVEKAERLESGRTEQTPLSARSLFQAIRELQYNLTEFCNGDAFVRVSEHYAQLQQAVDILKDPDIIASFGGIRRRNMWTVISEVSKSAFGTSPPVSSIVRLAVDGNRIFNLAADFDEGNFSPNELSELIDAGESYIINASLVGEAPSFFDDHEPAAVAEEENDEDAFEDDFEDF